MTVATDDTSKEIRGQRHQFIIEYYKMAVTDLDRHLKASWQTIAAVAGGLASISLAQEGKLVAPFAISTALIIAFWGMWNVIDGNYWALRAIAFLANVEATYFTEEDRRHFNPYAGRHPRFALLDSLKYQVVAISLFVVLILIYFGWRVFGQGYYVFAHKLSSSSLVSLSFWMVPVIITGLGVWYTTYIWQARLHNYLHFVSQSPGPGMVRGLPMRRSVEYVSEAPDVVVVSGDQIQHELVAQLRRSEAKWARIQKLTIMLMAIAVLLVIAIVVYFRRTGA